MILYIDTWDIGYRNFLRINKNLSQFEPAIMVHVGSFKTSKRKSIKERYIDGLCIRDISFYKTIYISRVIEIEKPRVIVILNISFIFDRAVILLAKRHNVKVIFLAHGKLIDPSSFLNFKEKLNRSVFSKLGRIVKKQNLFYLLNYLNAKNSKNFIFSFFSILIGISRNPSQYLTMAEYCEELDAENFLVYTESDKEHLVQNLNFPNYKVNVVGNPEISEFLKKTLKVRGVYLCTLGLRESEKYYLYLDDGLTAGALWSNQEWYFHLTEILNLITACGRKLVIKLHPRVDIANHKEFFDSNPGLLVVTDVDFKNLIFHSEGAISHYSTTITYCLIYHKNVIIPRWGKSGELMQNYPETIVSYCSSINEMANKLSNVPNKYLIDSYLQKNGIGKEDDSIKTITNYILN